MYKLPKYDWLCIYSVTRVKQNVHGAARKRHKVQSVPVEMQTRNAIYVADVGKNSSVRMAKTRQLNGRMHINYPVVQLTVKEQKISSRRRKSR